jgi:hypothetical protein
VYARQSSTKAALPSSALVLLVFGGEIGGPLGWCDGDRDCMKVFEDGESLPLCGEGM